jgi:hypothetical protein
MGEDYKMARVSVDIVPIQKIQSRVLIIRDQKVLIDADLADLYGVQTKRLNEQVKRNQERFPEDFMFQLSEAERDEVVANCDHLKRLKYSPGRPYAFTEHGAIMAASVLNTQRAIQVSVYVVRAFVQLRQLLTSHRDLARRLRQIERKLQKHDQCIIHMAEALNQLMPPPDEKPKRPIGFQTEAK